VSSSPTETDVVVDVTMPQMGVSVAEGTIVAWRVGVGDAITAEATICEISTDKIDTEVPAPAGGVVVEILVPLEATVAVVGPLTSVGIAIVVGLIGFGIDAAGGPALLVAGLYWLAAINIALALFNLIPGFPLDGGRLLRALLWQLTGDRVRATSQAAAVGRFFGFVLAALGVLEFFLSSNLIGGLWLVFLGWFLRSAAGAEESQVVATESLAGTRVADLMSSNPVVLPGSMSVEQRLCPEELGSCRCGRENARELSSPQSPSRCRAWPRPDLPIRSQKCSTTWVGRARGACSCSTSGAWSGSCRQETWPGQSRS